MLIEVFLLQSHEQVKSQIVEREKILAQIVNVSLPACVQLKNYARRIIRSVLRIINRSRVRLLNIGSGIDCSR